MFSNVYDGKRVLITGNTGFKGTWLTIWLKSLGANVLGYAIDIPSSPSLFDSAGLGKKIKYIEQDVCDKKILDQVFDESQPDIVFHLAAQSLVAKSYKDPMQTFTTNAIGTMNVLECVRQSPSTKAAVIITSDKAYRNVEWDFGYRETDTLGGEDPYSGSKACAELIFYSYYNSFFKYKKPDKFIATARAGNVIGGGDWAENRIVPDAARAWSQNALLKVRNPLATRPWQHVLEPLSGYLWLGANLLNQAESINGESFNFGPDAANEITVEHLIESLAQFWSGLQQQIDATSYGAEANLLKLCCDKALRQLQWKPVLSFEQTVAMTADWYKEYYLKAGSDMYDFTAKQIQIYQQFAEEKQLIWSMCPSLIASTV